MVTQQSKSLPLVSKNYDTAHNYVERIKLITIFVFSVTDLFRRMRANIRLDDCSYCAKAGFNNCFIIYLQSISGPFLKRGSQVSSNITNCF